MKKVCGLQFYSIRDILEKGGPVCPPWGLRVYKVRFKHEVGAGVPELKHVAMLEGPDKRRAWIYEIDGEVFLLIYEVEPFNNHKQYPIVVVKDDYAFAFPIELGFVKLFENQVLTLTRSEAWVSWFVGKLLTKDWLIRFSSGSKAKAGY